MNRLRLRFCGCGLHTAVLGCGAGTVVSVTRGRRCAALRLLRSAVLLRGPLRGTRLLRVGLPDGIGLIGQTGGYKLLKSRGVEKLCIRFLFSLLGFKKIAEQILKLIDRA